MYIGHFAHPQPPVFVFQFEDGIWLPMKVVGEIGYLLANPFEGVAYDPPRREMSTSIGVWHCGQVTGTSDVPCSLIWRYSR
jgi:hypothetical protein